MTRTGVAAVTLIAMVWLGAFAAPFPSATVAGYAQKPIRGSRRYTLIGKASDFY
jgi:hypothetical protein